MDKFFKLNELENNPPPSLKETINSVPDGLFKSEFLDFINEFPNALERACLEGHLTGSALVVRQHDKQILLMFHTKLQKWLQPGGHADGDACLMRVALKEAVEETGIQELKILDTPIDLDIHTVEPPGEGKHEHFDVRYLVVAAKDSIPVGNHESQELRWFSSKDLKKIDVDKGLLRMVNRGLEVLAAFDNDL